MTYEYILLTIVASLVSGLIGVVVSYIFYSRLEIRKIKFDTARKMFGSKYQVHGKDFQEAVNEVMIVFSDSQEVIDSMENLWKVVSTPQNARCKKAADEALILLMKSMCKNIGIKYKKLPDAYYLKYFSMPEPKV